MARHVTLECEATMLAQCVHACMHVCAFQDPLQRLTIEEIKAHPWFLELLPRNALSLSDRFLAEPMHARGECGTEP